MHCMAYKQTHLFPIIDEPAIGQILYSLLSVIQTGLMIEAWISSFPSFVILTVQPNTYCKKRSILWSTYIFKTAPTMMLSFCVSTEWWLLSVPENFSIASSEKEKLIFQGHWCQSIHILWGDGCQVLLPCRKEKYISVSLLLSPPVFLVCRPASLAAVTGLKCNVSRWASGYQHSFSFWI